MTPWSMRPLEQRTLLNPGFCSMLLWHAAIGHEDAPGAAGPMPLELAFVVLPIVLHRETRELLPSKASTSMAVWLEDHALARSRIAQRAPMLVPFVREALLFGGLHGFLRFQDATVVAERDWKKKVRKVLKDTTDEVAICTRKAEFVGRWLGRAGSAATVMTLLGVRP